MNSIFRRFWSLGLAFTLVALSGTDAWGGASGPTNAILFVTQVVVPSDFTTIASIFGNQQGGVDSCGRGGDLWIRYPNGTLRNLTRAAGCGNSGRQLGNAIAVRQPSVYWDGTKAVFSMVTGAPPVQYDISHTFYWQLYEITNFLNPAAIPIITKVPNQPTNFNNISPIYGTDDRIIFTSDRPRDGSQQLYPQLDEYEEAPTVSGVWSLNSTNGDLILLEQSPSGSFSLSLDTAGRVIFVRWDHMQRDQQADADIANTSTNVIYGTFDWSDESASSYPTTNRVEVYPGPRYDNGIYTGHTFNQFFPWQMNEDGTAEETVNHVGRHELGGSYAREDRTNDSNISDLYYFGDKYNTNTISNFTQVHEDGAHPGNYLAIDCPEFGTHSGGQLVSLTGSTNLTADFMTITYLTPRSTAATANDPTNPPSDDTGFYRNPIRTSDGFLIASHTSYTGASGNTGTSAFPAENYDFRLKFLVPSNTYYMPGAPLTGGITNNVSWWSPDELVTITNQTLWEFDPAEVVARIRPARREAQMESPEAVQFAKAGVDLGQFQNWLKLHQLALIISRDVTTRDEADFQQPFNLRIAASGHQTIGKPGLVYSLAWLQLFQADQLRSLNFGNTNAPRQGRRVLARMLHDPMTDNPPVTNTAPASVVKLGNDGSMAALVPARRALTWQLLDPTGTNIVRERYWLNFQAGEVRTCTSCHGINTQDQAGQRTPTNSPQALLDLLTYWKSRYEPLSGTTNILGIHYPTFTFERRVAASNLTYRVEYSTNLSNWLPGSQYTASNSIPNTAYTTELARSGTTNETIVLRGNTPVSSGNRQFFRVKAFGP
jgi:hypothetical protein